MTPSAPITVAIVEDQSDLRESLREVLDASPAIRFVAACANGEEAVRDLPELKPQVVFMDINLPGMDGVECVKQLVALPRTSARELSGNLGYRGFIVRVTHGADTQLIRIQAGTVHISKGVTNLYARDAERALERWLLDTGNPHLKSDIVEIVEREVR